MKRLLVPVVRQTSATSSGAASLSSVCRGFGITATEAEILRSCDRIDSGICIDDLESEAKGLGFLCDQLLVPVDHLLQTNANIPSIAVIRADGRLGSVVIWQQLCGLVQVMDPRSGRRWLPRKKLLERLYPHSQPVEPEALSAWMRTPAFQSPLERRIQQLHIPEAHTLVANAACEPGWQGLATLDAVVRQVFADADRRRTAHGNRPLVLNRWKEALLNSRTVPDDYWFARSTGKGGVWISGPVVLRIRPGRHQ